MEQEYLEQTMKQKKSSGRALLDGNKRINGNFERLEERVLLTTCTYDLNLDQQVNLGDDTIFNAAWQESGGYDFTPSSYPPPDTANWNYKADFDGDFDVDMGDYAWLSSNWQRMNNSAFIQYPQDPHDSIWWYGDNDMFGSENCGPYAEVQWFSEQYGKMAIAGDDDMFLIQVTNPQERRVVIDCRFEHDEGDIDLELYDWLGNLVETSASTGDNELLTADLYTTGGYFIRVTSPLGASGQRYDLKWDNMAVPDLHEEDDTVFLAPGLGNFPEDTWYSDVYDARGVANDDDYFMIDVPTGERLVEVELTFNHNDGMMGIYLIDSMHQITAFSVSYEDYARLSCYVPTTGTWYLKVFNVGGSAVNRDYDLKWTATPYQLEAVDDFATVDEDSFDNQITVLPNDIGTGLTVTECTGWTDGTCVYYTPYFDLFGDNIVSYKITDSNGISQWGRIYVTINPLPDAPIAQNDSATMLETAVNYQIDVLANDSDPDRDAIHIDSVWNLSGEPIGTATTDGSYVYFTPDQPGTNTLAYKLMDSTGRWMNGTIGVTAFNVDRPPEAGDDDATVMASSEGNMISVLLNDVDTDGDPLTITAFPVLPTKGTVSTDGKNAIYTPDEGEWGLDSFQYTINDGTGRTDTATVSILIIPGFDAHEEDDDRDQADALGDFAEGAIQSYQLDEDFYRIVVPTNKSDRIKVEAFFAHADGNIDIELIGSTGMVIAGSYSTDDDEVIDTTTISPGTYYIRVFTVGGPAVGENYVMQWQCYGPADPHEPDNTFAQADALGSLPASLPYRGVLNDDDIYQIMAMPGMSLLDVTCSFDANDGNLNLSLYDSSGVLIRDYTSDNIFQERFNKWVPAGIYYIRVWSPDAPAGQEYNLKWQGKADDDKHEQDDSIAQAAAREEELRSGISFSDAVGGKAVNRDDDYFEIYARPGFEKLIINCYYQPDEGNLDILLYDSEGDLLDWSSDGSGIETINTTVPSSGYYYVCVTGVGAPTDQTYDFLYTERRADDLYEENDKQYLAELADYMPRDTWLTGRSFDRDYYKIGVPMGRLHVTVDLDAPYIEGDLSLYVYDAAEKNLASSVTHADSEHIEIDFPKSGDYYIHVYPVTQTPTGQEYQLKWSFAASDDWHEQDDTWAQADAKGALASLTVQEGVQNDDDIYAIDIPPFARHVRISCEFDNSLGDIDIQLADPDHIPLAAGTTTSDSEFIDITTPTGGRHYIMVYAGGAANVGQDYTLQWNCEVMDDDHEHDNTRGQADMHGLLAEDTWLYDRVSWESDVYKIEVPAGQPFVQVDCVFDDSLGNINLVLVDSNGDRVAAGMGGTDSDRIRAILDPGIYYIGTYTFERHRGIQYDLKWFASKDDFHEEDDTIAQAEVGEALPLDTPTDGTVWDVDYWRIDVQPGREQVTIWCERNDFGDGVMLWFELFDEDGKILETYPGGPNALCVLPDSTTHSYGDISLTVPEAGSYYIMVKTSEPAQDIGSHYTLRWKDLPGAEYDWTVMLYMDADSNLDEQLTERLNEVFDTLPPGNVAVTIMFDPADGGGIFFGSNAFRMRLGDNNTIEDLGEVNMGENAVFEEFMTWSVENYPAHKYMLALVDHGYFDHACSQDRRELADSIESIRPIDYLHCQVCLFGNIETAYELRHATDYITFSENVSYDSSHDYGDLLTYMYGNPEPINAARATINNFIANYYAYDDGQTWSAVHTYAVAELTVPKIDAFAQTVISDATPADIVQIQRIRNSVRSFENEYVDLGSFLERVGQNSLITPSIRTAAQDARQYWAVLTAADMKTPHTTGMAVNYPKTPRLDYYDAGLDFAADTHWNEMLLFILGDDEHEEDDSVSQSMAKPNLAEDTPATGKQWDSDFYRIEVPKTDLQVQITCDFLHSEGNVNIYLKDQFGTIFGTGASNDDDEVIDVKLPAGGAYYIQVLSPPVDDNGTIHGSGQEYTLTWSASVASGDVIALAPAGDLVVAGPLPATVTSKSLMQSLLVAPQWAGIITSGDDIPTAGKIDMECVVLTAPSGADTSGTLPTGVAEVDRGSTFVVEVWVRNLDASENGIVGGYMNFTFNSMLVSPTGVSNGGIYTIHPVATAHSGSIDLGGAAALGVVDMGDDEWVRLGYATFSADSVGACGIMTSSGEDELARAYEGSIEWADVERDVPMVSVDIVLPAPSASVDLQSGSDSGMSNTDNITNDNTPTFDVTVNRAGTIKIDYDGNAVWDEERAVGDAGTYQFTPGGPLADGDFTDYPVNVDFVVSGVGTASDSDAVTIDTQGPSATQWQVALAHGGGVGEVINNISTGYVESRYAGLKKFIITFDETLDASSVSAGDLSVVGVANGDQSGRISSVTGSGDKVTALFSTALPDVDRYSVSLGTDVRDAAGNQMTSLAQISVRALRGDANGNGQVDSFDLLNIRAFVGQAVNASNARRDINGDGIINSFDQLMARVYVGNKVT